MKKPCPLRIRVALIFIGIVSVVLLLVFLLNRLFWNNLNLESSKRLLKDTYTSLATMVADADTTEEDFQETIRQVRTTDDMSFALEGSSEWDFMVVTSDLMSTDEKDFLLERLQSDMLNADTEGVTVYEKTDNYTLQMVNLADGSGRYMECFGFMRDAGGTDRKFILSLPLEHIYTLSSRSMQFIGIIGLGLLVLGAVVVSYLTYLETKPIVRLTEISKRMSRLDFSVRYNGNRQDEIGELGNNMNEMASQLERTILQLKLSNESLAREVAEKDQVDAMRKEFISNVSHELKTPIALIQGYAEGLQEMQEDEDSRNYYIEVIMDEAGKMNRMVQKLMTLNQLEFGQDGLDIEPFDIMEMMKGIIRGSAKLQEEHKATVKLEGPDHLMVLGDEFKLEEVFKNYFSNAFNHVEEPGLIRIFVDDLGANARISVFNTGKQIPEDALEKVWIKFYKVDKARTRAYGGSGIGLSIVKAIMEAHKKEYGVYNTKDGVVFWFEVEKQEQTAAFDFEKARIDGENEEIKGTDMVNGTIVKEL